MPPNAGFTGSGGGGGAGSAGATAATVSTGAATGASLGTTAAVWIGGGAFGGVFWAAAVAARFSAAAWAAARSRAPAWSSSASRRCSAETLLPYQTPSACAASTATRHECTSHARVTGALRAGQARRSRHRHLVPLQRKTVERMPAAAKAARDAMNGKRKCWRTHAMKTNYAAPALGNCGIAFTYAARMANDPRVTGRDPHR